MIHDPLCKLPNEWETFLDVDGHRTIRRRCYCDLIRKVRVEERQACAEDVANMLRHLPYVPANSPAAIEWAENYIRDIHEQAD